MTAEQYERWKDFAYRMATTHYKGRRNPGRGNIRQALDDFFHDLGEDWVYVRDWDYSESYPVGHKYHPGRMYCVADICAEMEEGLIPDYWALVDDDGFEAIRDRWCGPMRCCLRAGLDLAASHSGGVLGFCAGDLRRMYPEGMPSWIKDGVNWETIKVGKVLPGVGFVIEETSVEHPFDALPDDAELWL